MKLNQQPAFETLQELEHITLKSMIGLDFLKLRVVLKNKGKTNEVYDTFVKQLSNEGKLSEYFQNYQELNQYLKINENIKIDAQKKSLEIIGKGPTKKSNYIQIAQLKLLPIQLTFKSNLADSKIIKEKHNISSQEAEEWMDTLATQIVSMIQHKSRITQKSPSLSQYIKKTQLEQILAEAKKQVKTQIQNLKEIIKNLQQNNNKNKKQQNQLKQIQHLTQNNEREIRTKQSIKQLEKKIKQISQKVDGIIEQNTKITIKMIKEQTEKMSQNLIKEFEAKDIQISKLYSKKEQMDVIIKKIQQIGSKVQFISNETVKKQQDKEKSQDSLFFKPNGINLLTPKKSHNKFDIETSFRAERSGNNKKASDYVPQTPVNADTWIDPKCSHVGRVSLKCNTITINSYGGAHLFGKISIKENSVFNILIQQLTGKMAVGVADSSYKQNLLFGDEPNKIYYQSNRRFFDGVKHKQEEGEGFTKGEIITVCADLKLGTILWKVGGKLRHSWQSDELRNQKIAWVPYIRLFQKGDMIQILE